MTRFTFCFLCVALVVILVVGYPAHLEWRFGNWLHERRWRHLRRGS